jgi:CMP-N-acetylneuraminic acid synthetase
MIDGRRILAVVPARGGSKGINLKNLRKIGGIPMVARVGMVVKQIEFIDRAVVSTDHEEIAKVARESGLAVPFFRPPKLSGDIISDLEVLTHAHRTMEEIDNCQYDIIVMLQPTSPLRTARHVVDTINKLIEGNYDAVWTVSETDSKAHPLKQLTLLDGKLDYYDSDGGKIVARQQLKKVYHRNGAAYTITRDCLYKKKSIKGEKTSAVVIDEPMISIDTELDIQFAEFFLRLEL